MVNDNRPTLTIVGGTSKSVDDLLSERLEKLNAEEDKVRDQLHELERNRRMLQRQKFDKDIRERDEQIRANQQKRDEELAIYVRRRHRLLSYEVYDPKTDEHSFDIDGRKSCYSGVTRCVLNSTNSAGCSNIINELHGSSEECIDRLINLYGKALDG
jgi:DNA-binding transcriptional LysR family regulator